MLLQLLFWQKGYYNLININCLFTHIWVHCSKKTQALADIRRDKDLQSQIHWDMKPRERIRRTRIETEEEMAQIEKQLQARVGYYFYIDVRNRHAGLYLYENYPDGSGRFVEK